MSLKYNDKLNNKEILLAGMSPTDLVLDGTSKNPIANKAVYNALKEKIDKTVSDLANYYTKADIYNKTEVRALINAVDTLSMEVVSGLPTSDISTTTIYLLKQTGSNSYDEYVYINNAWVMIGTTSMDLSQYVTNDNLTLALGDYYSKVEMDIMLANYALKADYYNKDQVDDFLDAKQGILTFDSTPTAESGNPVTSAGIKSSLDAKQNVLTFDTTPTNGSTNPVTSGGIYSAFNYTLFRPTWANSWNTEGQWAYNKFMGFCTPLLYNKTINLTANTNVLVGTLPEKARPAINCVYRVTGTGAGSSEHKPVIIQLLKTGEIYITAPQNMNANLWMGYQYTISWPITP